MSNARNMRLLCFSSVTRRTLAPIKAALPALAVGKHTSTNFTPEVRPALVAAAPSGVPKAPMYKCICKRCGHRVNRLFVIPEQVRERWLFGCPQCGHKSALPDFSALAAKAIYSGKCLTPFLCASARGWKDKMLGALQGAAPNHALKDVAKATIASIRRKFCARPMSRQRRGAYRGGPRRHA